MTTNIAQRDAIAHRARARPTNLEPYVTIDKIWILFNSHLNNIDSYVYSYVVFLVNDCCRFTLTSPVVSKTKSEFSCRNMLPLSFSPIMTVHSRCSVIYNVETMSLVGTNYANMVCVQNSDWIPNAVWNTAMGASQSPGWDGGTPKSVLKGSARSQEAVESTTARCCKRCNSKRMRCCNQFVRWTLVGCMSWSFDLWLTCWCASVLCLSAAYLGGGNASGGNAWWVDAAPDYLSDRRLPPIFRLVGIPHVRLDLWRSVLCYEMRDGERLGYIVDAVWYTMWKLCL